MEASGNMLSLCYMKYVGVTDRSTSCKNDPAGLVVTLAELLTYSGPSTRRIDYECFRIIALRRDAVGY